MHVVYCGVNDITSQARFEISQAVPEMMRFLTQKDTNKE